MNFIRLQTEGGRFLVLNKDSIAYATPSPDGGALLRLNNKPDIETRNTFAEVSAMLAGPHEGPGIPDAPAARKILEALAKLTPYGNAPGELDPYSNVNGKEAIWRLIRWRHEARIALGLES